MKHPRPRIEFTLRDWCSIKEAEISCTHCMDIDTFEDLLKPAEVIKDIYRSLKSQMKVYKENNKQKQLKEHWEKITKDEVYDWQMGYLSKFTK